MCLAGLVLTTTFFDVNGVRLRVVDAGPDDGPVVVLAHGFPELAFSWRHQIPALAAAGYRVLAPDQRGYGGSSSPEEVEAYDITALTGDLVGLIDAVGAERAAIVGHDWGATVAWIRRACVLRRVMGCVVLNHARAPAWWPTSRARWMA